MKRCLLALLVLLMLGTACASAAVLPMDTETFTPIVDEKGVTCLEWDGPVLPAGLEYELKETVITGWERRFEPYTVAGHKFARITYTGADGGARDAWVMAHNLNRAQFTPLNTEEAALGYARRFLQNQYVQAATAETPVRVSPMEGGWKAEALDDQGSVTHVLMMDENGVVLQFADLLYQPVDVSGGAEHNDALANLADTYGAHGVLEWSSRELLPGVGYNSVATIAFNQETHTFTFLIDHFDFYVALQVEPEVRMVAYGDMRTDAAYGDYLNRQQALEIVIPALAQAQNLTEAELTKRLQVNHFTFSAKPHYWTTSDIPLPYWVIDCCILPETDDQLPQECLVLVDAQNGGVVEILDPAQMGNG